MSVRWLVGEHVIAVCLMLAGVWLCMLSLPAGCFSVGGGAPRQRACKPGLHVHLGGLLRAGAVHREQLQGPQPVTGTAVAHWLVAAAAGRLPAHCWQQQPPGAAAELWRLPARAAPAVVWQHPRHRVGARVCCSPLLCWEQTGCVCVHAHSMCCVFTVCLCACRVGVWRVICRLLCVSASSSVGCSIVTVTHVI